MRTLKKKKWYAVQVDHDTKMKLGAIKGALKDSEAHHIRNAVSDYYAKRENDKARADGVAAARNYLIRLARKAKGAL